MKFPFSIKPFHWYDYLNPFWWNRKEKIERFLAYTWETQNLECKVNDAIKDALLTGRGQVLWDWGRE